MRKNVKLNSIKINLILNLFLKKRLLYTILFLLFTTSNIQSETINKYSYSNLKKEYTIYKNSSSFPKITKKIVLINDSENFYRLEASGDRINIVEDESKKTLSYVSAKNEDGAIYNITLSKDKKWLWIDGSTTDYIAMIRLENSSNIVSEPKPLPNLCAKPCSYFGKWYDGKHFPANGHYSHTLDRVFITGHRPNWFGTSNPVSYEVIGSKAKLLPKELQGTYVDIDFQSEYPYAVIENPKLKGVVLKKNSSKKFFYNGCSFFELKN